MKVRWMDRRGADRIEGKRYDLILLDLMLPKISGYELLDYIVSTGIPLIIISAMGQVKDCVRGLRMGADDYLSKPFQIGELLARVETVLRRTKQIQDKITIGDVKIDPVSRLVFKCGKQVDLTVKLRNARLCNNDKNTFHLPRQYLPKHYGRKCYDIFS